MVNGLVILMVSLALLIVGLTAALTNVIKERLVYDVISPRRVHVRGRLTTKTYVFYLSLYNLNR